MPGPDERRRRHLSERLGPADREPLVRRRRARRRLPGRAEVRDPRGDPPSRYERAVALPSAGYRTVDPWIARNDARSSSAICDGPSSPIDTPACDPQSRRSARPIARHADLVVRRESGTPRTSRRTRSCRAPAGPSRADHASAPRCTSGRSVPVRPPRRPRCTWSSRPRRRGRRRRRAAPASQASASPNAFRVAIALGVGGRRASPRGSRRLRPA